MKCLQRIRSEWPTFTRARLVGKRNSWVLRWGDYVVVTTTESDEKGPKEPGAINGGFFQKTDDKPSQYPSLVIAVDDIKEHMKTIEEAGGKVLGQPWDIPGIGLYVSFLDTEGDRASIIQPSRK